MERRARALFVALCLSLLLVLASAGAALGHVLLVGSDPADGATVGGEPHAVRLTFSEEVKASLAKIQVFDGAGAAVPNVTVDGDPSDETALIVNLPAIRPGAYRLAWVVVDTTDLHVTTGDVVFGVGQPAPAHAASALAGVDPVQAAARWIDLLLQVLLAGALVLLAAAGLARQPATSDLAASSAVRSRLRRRLVRLAAVAGVGALVSGVVLLGLQVAEAAQAAPSLSSAFGAAIGTLHGAGWLLRQAALAGLVGTAVLLGRAEPGGARRGLVAVAAGLGVAVALGNALGGHVGIGSAGEQPLRIVALAVHAAAAAAWVGGLVVLAITIAPLLRRPVERSVAGSVLRRFWLVALPSVACLAVSGLYLSGQLVATPDALLTSAYGLILLVKVAVVAVVLLLGAHHALALHPGLRRRLPRPVGGTLARVPGPRHMGRSVALEAGLALVAVLAAAALGSTPPARGAGLDPLPVEVAQPDVAGRASDLVVTMAVRPNRPGQNFVSLGVFNSRRPAPGPIGNVTVILRSPTGQVVQASADGASADGRYQLPVTLPDTSGAWQATVTVQRQGLPVARLDAPWTVHGAVAEPAAVIVSQAPLANVTTPLAAVGGLAATVIALAAALLARRRRRAAPGDDAQAAVSGPDLRPAPGLPIQPTSR